MLRAALLLFAATGWKVKSTTARQSLLRDLWEIILPASFQTAGALWAKAITSVVSVPVKRRPLPGDICWAPFRGILLRYSQCFACGNGKTRCKPGRNAVYPSSESNWLRKRSYLLNSAQSSYRIAAVGLDAICFRRLENPRKHLK